MIDCRFHFRRCIDQRRVNNRRATIMADFFRSHQIENGLRIDFSQTNISSCLRGDGPWETPTVAMKHRQCPQINRMTLHVPRQHIADGVHVRAAMVIHHPLRIARCARRIIQRDRIPFVAGIGEFEIGITSVQKSRVVLLAQSLCAAVEHRINHIDHRRRLLDQRQRFFDGGGVFRIAKQHLRFAVIEHEGDGFRVEPRVQGVEHGADHRRSKMQVDQRRNIRQHCRYRISFTNADFSQSRGQLAATHVLFFPGIAFCAVNNRGSIRIDVRGLIQK